MDLLDLVDRDVLVRLQRKFSDLLGFNVAFTGLNSRIIGMGQERPTLPGSICELMKSKAEGDDRCYGSDFEAGLESRKIGGKPLLYRCQCYFSNFVIPIKVSNAVIGFLYGGQFFCYRPDQDQEAEWDALKEETDAMIRTEDGKYIRAQFFHNDLGKPTEKDLIDVGQRNGLTAVGKFISMFHEQSDTRLPTHKVKSATEILRAISILSEVANTLSEESNLSYALKIHFETCQKMTESRLQNINRKLADQYTTLCGKLETYLQDLKVEESKEDRLKLVQEIETESIGILQKMKQQEQRGIVKAQWMNKWLFVRKRKA
jgi:ligand-binding sensor protein